mmetsp:Transcript_137628/g.242634  ORF Transcript_137628/g.242634 Transcript_137628/m.242634 type:complete len:471 (-) Transcript_137628:66-1478(-)
MQGTREMSFTMGRVSLVLIGLAGQAVQHSFGQVQHQDSTREVKALASALLAQYPGAAFNAPGFGARTKSSSDQSRAHGAPNMASDFEPPFWAPGLKKRAFERIPGPVREPWVPSWLDEDEQRERRLEEAVKWRPEYIPEPWIGPATDDDERAKIWDEHDRVLAAQAAAPCPSWVTDWLREAGKAESEIPTTVGECMPYVGKILPGQRIIFKPPPWAEGLTKREFEQIPEPAREPWIPSWADEEEKAERRLEAAEKWRPDYIPEPWALGDFDERKRIMDRHKLVLQAQRDGPPPDWVIDYLKEHGKPLPTTVGEIMDTPAPVPEPWKPSWVDDDEEEEETKPEPAPEPEPVAVTAAPVAAAPAASSSSTTSSTTSITTTVPTVSSTTISTTSTATSISATSKEGSTSTEASMEPNMQAPASLSQKFEEGPPKPSESAGAGEDGTTTSPACRVIQNFHILTFFIALSLCRDC